MQGEAITSLAVIILAQRYFGWDMNELIKEAEKDEALKKFKCADHG